MKRIKFPLVMKNGAEVRTIEELRENFDMESVAEYFTNGKLIRWLENNYYDEILEEIQDLKEDEAEFGEQLAKALGVEWEDKGKLDLQYLMKFTELKEQLKPYISEEELEKMEYIADSQEELERLAKEGDTPVYLFGSDFKIRNWMKDMECIGINQPTVHLEVQDRKEFKKSKLKLRNIEFAEKEMKKVAMGDSEVSMYYDVVDVLGRYLQKVEKELG